MTLTFAVLSIARLIEAIYCTASQRQSQRLCLASCIPALNQSKLLKQRRNKMVVKKSYAQPKLTAYGNVEVLTQGLKNGDGTDAVFPVKTPKEKLTFS
jgi:hypothetical protein